jgi:hypothetical protein
MIGRLLAQAISASVLLSLVVIITAAPNGAPFVFQMIPETSVDNPIKSPAAKAVMQGSPFATAWWALIRALNESGCVQQAAPSWFHDPTFWFVSANSYGESSVATGPYHYCVQAWSGLPDEGGELLATSNSVTVHFDFTRQSLTATLSASFDGCRPGEVNVSANYAVSPD